MLAPGGWSIEDHSTIGDAPKVLASGRWDAVVLQQGPSALPESQVNLRTWAMRAADDARKQGARPALYQVWPERDRFAVFPDVLASYRTRPAPRARSCSRPATPGGRRGGAIRSSSCTGRTGSTRAGSARTSPRS